MESSSNIASLAKVWNQDVPASGEPEKLAKKALKFGEKGVVCFGEQSNQYYNPYKGFTKDSDLNIKPFVVELRFSMI